MSTVALRRWFERPVGGSWGDNAGEGERDALCIRGTDLVFDRLEINAESAPLRGFSSEDVRRRSLLSGDIVIEKSGGGDTQPVGRVGLFRGSRIAVPTNFAARLRPRGRVNPRFACYQLASLYFAGRTMAAVKQTTGIQNLDLDELLANRAWLPPLVEQRAIADYLDAETARIDVLIAKKQQLIHLLDERVAALVDAHFSPRATEATVRLSRLASIQTGITLNSAKVSDGKTVRMPYLRVANVQPGWLDLAEVKEVEVEPAAAARSLLQVGDVLMTEGGDIDKLGRGTVWRGQIDACLHQNHVFAVRPHPGQLDSDFLANVTRTSHARAYFESTGVQSTNLASTNSFKVADFRVPAIDLRTQRARCTLYERSLQPLSDSSTKLTRQLELVAEHRQALITAAVTGEFTVPGAA